MERNERDAQILQLFEQRSEDAISAAALQYGGLCRQIAMNILGNAEDAEECVNDTWLAVWNRIPPEQPRSLTAYICRIVRNLSLDRMDYLRAGKRNAAATSSLEAIMELNQEIGLTDIQLEAVSEHEAFTGLYSKAYLEHEVQARLEQGGQPLYLAVFDIDNFRYINEFYGHVQGDAVLLISSELTEIMSLSDRIYVIYEGRAAGEFRKADATEEALGILMMGGALHEN